ncbi:hypothetical protein V6Z11_D02G080200 [Gossypium hirsutum]
MVVDLSPKVGVSWKDKLLRGKADGPSLNFGIINEEDLVFVEGDILRSTVNGIPTINFSDQIKDWLVKDMETNIVVKLLGRNMSYGVLHNRISNSWRPFQPTEFPIHGDPFNHFTLWMSKTVIIWLGFLYKRQVLEEIGSLISKVARLDIKIDSGIRGRFARMVVFVDLEKSFVLQIIVNGKVQRVEFESLPAVCFSCGCYGHIKDFCPSIVLDPNSIGKTLGRMCPLFGESIDSFELLDLGFWGLQFTLKRGEVFKRLDRTIFNVTWNSALPYAMITHLPKLKSDHQPLLLDLQPDFYSSKGCPFRFLTGWIEHPGFSNFVKENWSISDSMLMTHSNFTNKVRHWNKDVYGHITSCKNHLFPYLHQLEMEVREELDNILHHEELLWRQKVKCD